MHVRMRIALVMRPPLTPRRVEPVYNYYAHLCRPIRTHVGGAKAEQSWKHDANIVLEAHAFSFGKLPTARAHSVDRLLVVAQCKRDAGNS